MKFFILTSLSGSLTGFRKPLIQALVDNGLEVHAAAPDEAKSEVYNMAVGDRTTLNNLYQAYGRR